MAKTLTTKAVENFKPNAARYEVPDRGCRGLYCIVQPSGARSWAIRFRIKGEPAKHTLGTWPVVSLAEARRQASAAMAEIARGVDPRIEKQQARADAAARGRDTIDSLAAQFIERYAKRHTRPNSWRQTIHVFEDIVLPVWSGRNVHDIERRDIKELVEGLAASRPVMANRTTAILGKFFNWLCENDILKASPCAGVKLPSRETPRERVLSDPEIRALWLACDDIGGGAGACVKLLLLTGQRRSEIANLKWSEVDGNLLVLPGERMKGRTAHLAPLSTLAISIIGSLPHAGEYVFGASPVTHFNRIKDALDERVKPATPWVVHDIRRTVASGMARIGVSVPVVEKILGHKSGTFRGIVGTYQRHSFLPEMAAAMQKWADHVERIVSGQSADVLQLGRR
jgi:integrase